MHRDDAKRIAASHRRPAEIRSRALTPGKRGICQNSGGIKCCMADADG